MNRILLGILAITLCLKVSDSKFYTEEQKEHFFDMIHSTPQGQKLLKQVTNHLMTSTSAYLKDQIVDQVDSLNSLKNCMLCKTAFGTIDEVMRTETVINALESFGILVCD